MKKLSVLLCLSMVLGLGVSNAGAVGYVSGNLGVGWVEDLGLTDGTDDLDLSFDPGFGITAAFGHAYNNGLRAEVELGYFKSDLDEVTLKGFGKASVDGDGTLMSVMLNAFYDFMPGSTMSPFLGAGIGYANAELDVEGSSEDDNLFAYQASAGVAFKVSERMKCDVQYRYFGTEDPDFGSGVDSDSIAIHNLMVGLRYSF